MKTVFISYLHSEVDSEKLNRLIQLLEDSNIRVIIDDRDMDIGDDLPLFMERSLIESDYIIVVLSSGYKKRADERKGGVGYEASIMASTLSKDEAVKKFLPVTFEAYREEIVPVFLASKVAADFSDGVETVTFQHSFEKIKKKIMGRVTNHRLDKTDIPTKTVKNTDNESVSLVSNEDDENTQIMIVSIDTDGVTQPRNDGTPGSALYAIPFQLNHSPNTKWEKMFLEKWRFPSEFTLMHRGNIASVSGNQIILDGTTMEEVRDYHLKTLKLVIEDTNKQYKELVVREKLREKREIDMKEEQRNKMKSIIENLDL